VASPGCLLPGRDLAWIHCLVVSYLNILL
jgi:hypothetical protein